MRELEPNVAPGVRSGLLAKGDHQVETRRFVSVLLAAAQARGVQFRRAAVTAVDIAGGAVSGVHSEAGQITRRGGGSGRRLLVGLGGRDDRPACCRRSDR